MRSKVLVATLLVFAGGMLQGALGSTIKPEPHAAAQSAASNTLDPNLVGENSAPIGAIGPRGSQEEDAPPTRDIPGEASSPPPVPTGLDVSGIGVLVALGLLIMAQVGSWIWLYLQSRHSSQEIEEIRRQNERQLNDHRQSVEKLDRRVLELEERVKRTAADPPGPKIIQPRHIDQADAAAPTAQVLVRPTLRSEPSHTSVSELERFYREIIPTRSRQRLNQLVDEYGARGYGLLAPGALQIDLGRDPLLFGVEIGDGKVAVVPGTEVILNFATQYASVRSMPEEISAAFEFSVDGTRLMKLDAASIWERNGADALHLVRKGSIGGLND